MNTFDNNMAYISGNAVWVRMTRPDSGWCGAITMLDDVFTNNFGSKITSGTVAIICDQVTSDQNDFAASSSWTQSQIADGSGTLVDPSTLNNLSFVKNYAGFKGACLYLKGMSITLTNSNFNNSGAVDALREMQFLPAYTTEVIGLTDGVPNRLFTYD